MGKGVRAIAAVAGVMAMVAMAMPASAEELSGRYETFDGRIQHDFRASAVYAATVYTPTRILSFEGLYQQGDNVCLAGVQGDATGGAGNVLLYVGENECCLEVRRIADKFAVTKKGVTGDQHGPGFYLCQHQFLKRMGGGAATPRKKPPAASASQPRKLQP